MLRICIQEVMKLSYVSWIELLRHKNSVQLFDPHALNSYRYTYGQYIRGQWGEGAE